MQQMHHKEAEEQQVVSNVEDHRRFLMTKTP